MQERSGPTSVQWSEHAQEKARRLSASFVDVEDGVLANHGGRTSNDGAADWQVRVGPWVVAYDYPSDDDAIEAKIVTLWRP